MHVAGAIVNKVDLRAKPDLARTLERGLARHGIPLLGVLPYRPILSNPTLAMVLEGVKGETIHPGPGPRPGHRRRRIGAMEPEHMLQRIGRARWSSCRATARTSSPRSSMPGESTAPAGGDAIGLVLTGGYRPRTTVLDAIRHADLFATLVPRGHLRGRVRDPRPARQDACRRREKIAEIKALVWEYLFIDRMLEVATEAAPRLTLGRSARAGAAARATAVGRGRRTGTSSPSGGAAGAWPSCVGRRDQRGAAHRPRRHRATPSPTSSGASREPIGRRRRRTRAAVPGPRHGRRRRLTSGSPVSGKIMSERAQPADAAGSPRIPTKTLPMPPSGTWIVGRVVAGAARAFRADRLGHARRARADEPDEDRRAADRIVGRPRWRTTDQPTSMVEPGCASPRQRRVELRLGALLGEGGQGDGAAAIAARIKLLASPSARHDR